MPPPVHGQSVGIRVDASKAIAKVGKLQAGLAVSHILRGIAAVHLEWIGDNLERAGNRQDGLPWQQMAPITIARRPRRTSSSHFSSTYQALLQQSQVESITGYSVTVGLGSNAKYAVFHHEGARRGNWVLPARKMLPQPQVAAKLAADVVQAIVDQLVGGLNS